MFSRNTWKVFAYELSRNLWRRGFLFMTFGIPALAFVLLLGYQVITQLTKSEQTEEETAVSQMFDFGSVVQAGYVDFSGVFHAPQGQLAEIMIPYPDLNAAQSALDAGEIDVFYVIEPDYLETGNVTLNIPELSLNQILVDPIDQLVYSQLAGDTDPFLLLRLRFPANFVEINPTREGATDEGSRFGVLYLFSIMLILGLFVTSGYLMQSVIEEKETRLIEILVSSVRPTQLLTGKVLALGIVGIVQVVTWVIALFLLARTAGLIGSDIDFLNNLTIPWSILPVVLVYFVLGYLLFAAAFGAVGALSASMQEGPQYAIIFTLPAAIPYYFLAVFIQSPDATLPVVMSLFPLTAPLSMVMRLTVSNVPFVEVALSLLILAVSTAGTLWLAGRLFRVQSLLAGQVPKLRDIPRLLRG